MNNLQGERKGDSVEEGEGGRGERKKERKKEILVVQETTKKTKIDNLICVTYMFNFY